VLGIDGAVLDPRPGPATAATRGRAKRTAALSRLRAGRLGRRPVLAELVIETALLRVGEDLLRLGDLLEARLGLLVPRVQVGVILARQLAEGGRNFFLR